MKNNLKNIVAIFSLTLMMFVSYGVSAQTIDFKSFETKRMTVLDWSSKKVNNTSQFKNISFDTKDTPKTYTTNNDYEIITIPLIGNSTVLNKLATNSKMFLYISKDPSQKIETNYFVSISENIITIMDSNYNELYSITKDGKNGRLVAVNNTASKKTAFQVCMSDAEEAVTDNFIGWVAWNYSPGVQLAAAINCALTT